MINIQNSQIIYYGNDQSVTVYFDFDPAVKKMYVVPVPAIVYQNGEPLFSLTKYIKNEGAISGICYFDVELSIPANALLAVQQSFPDYVLGQFDWISALSFFTYDVAGELIEITATPSMYGAQRATFTVPITSDDMLKTFVNAFNAHDSQVSPFHAVYDLVTLTKLEGVSATVSYNAEVAVSFEKQMGEKKDTWGNKQSVVIGVKKNLKQSGAGTVLIDWKVPKTPELELRVTDWAWATLEKAVADAVELAEKAAVTQDPLVATSSFIQTYEENSVVEWIISTSNALTRFNNETWAKVYHEVDLRELVVTFNTLGVFTKSDGKDAVQKIDITVNYPTREPITFSLYPTSSNNNSYVYTAPGYFDNVGGFDGNYSYKYQVFYNGIAPYESPVIYSADTLVTINPSLVGLRAVTFIGSNIPFTPATGSGGKETVDKVIIDFFFIRPEGVPNKVEQKVMLANGIDNAVKFESYYGLPLENTYTYRYTYEYSNGRTIIESAKQAFGSENSDTKMITYPLGENEFTLKALKTSADSTIIETDLTVQYKGVETGEPINHRFSWSPSFEKSIYTESDPWKFVAPKNLDSAYFEINGSIIFSDDYVPINNLRQPATNFSLLLTNTTIPYTITINTSMIDWEAVENVVIHLFEMPNGKAIIPHLLEYYLPALPAGMLRDKEKSLLASESKKNQLSYSILSPEATRTEGPLYYNIHRLRNSSSLTFYISAEYIQADGKSKKFMHTVTVKDQTIYILPPNGDSDTPSILSQTIELPVAIA